jgi:hypothetical protein
VRDGLKRALAPALIALSLWLGVGAAGAFDRVRVVSVTTVDGAALEPALWETLRELFARVGVSLTAEPQERDAAAITVRLAARAGGMDVIVTSAAHEPVHRRVDASSSEALFRETIGHVVLGVVEPLLDEPPPSAAPADAAAKAPSSAAHLRVGLSGGALGHEQRRIVPRVGIGVGVALDRALAPSLVVEAALSTGRSLAEEEVAARLYLLSLRARPTLTFLAERRVAIDVGLPLGFDVALLDLTHVPQEAASDGRETRVDPVLGPLVGARVALTRTLDLTLSLGVDLTLRPRRFVVRDEDETERLAALARVRPYLTLGLDWTARSGARIP